MFHRNYGETQNCKGCRFWSEMIAQANGDGVTAMCINSGSPEKGKYKADYQKCDKWASGHYGAIDSPGEAEEIARLYTEEDAV